MTRLLSSVTKVRSIVDPAFRQRQKTEAELAYWRGEMKHLADWFQAGTTDWWGIKPPLDEQKLNVSSLWIVNAIATMHAMRPSYTEELKADRKHFAGCRVLEIGNGPLAPIMQFEDCERHGVDPLNNLYMAAGWPIFEYDAKFISQGGEMLPYPDNYFDAALSVNALDHVDDFQQVVNEMQRVVKPGGEIRFEVEYHEPTIPEPFSLDDDQVRTAFSKSDMHVVSNRSGREMFDEMIKKFDLLPPQTGRFGDERFVLWSGTVR